MGCWLLLKLEERVRWVEKRLLAVLENSNFLCKDVCSLLDFSVGQYSIVHVFQIKGIMLRGFLMCLDLVRTWKISIS